MVGINPFAKKQQLELLEPTTAQLFGKMIHEGIDAVVGMQVTAKITTTRKARCGGRFKPCSIKQRTRLNRDMRNRERRYARYLALMNRP